MHEQQTNEPLLHIIVQNTLSCDARDPFSMHGQHFYLLLDNDSYHSSIHYVRKLRNAFRKLKHRKATLFLLVLIKVKNTADGRFRSYVTFTGGNSARYQRPVWCIRFTKKLLENSLIAT